MYRATLPRIYELKDLLRDPEAPKSFFKAFDCRLGISNQIMQAFVEREAELQQLNPISWNVIKEKAKPLLEIKDKKRGWHQLIDTLNEVRGYNYLSRLGCTEPRFIPRADSKGTRTPDLQGAIGILSIVCEVKTIHISEKEIDARTKITLRDGANENRLPQEFLNKLNSDLVAARDQLLAYCDDANARRIIYMVINFDNFTTEHDAEYFNQIDAFCGARQLQDVEVVIHDMRPQKI